MIDEKESVEKEEDENVEVDLDDVKTSEEAVKEEPKDATPSSYEPEQVEAEEPVQEEKQEKQKPTKFQKRIDDLTFERREAERQRDEYYNVAQRAVEENKKLREQAKNFSEIGTKEMEGHINSEIESSKEAYKRAYEEGDADKIIAAQQKMIEASTRRTDLNQLKQYSDQSRFDNDYAQSVPPPPNNKAVQWAGKNTWFNKDMVMTNAAYTIHDELIKSGIQGDTDEYYQQLDARIQQEFPHKFASEQMTEQKPTTVAKTLVTPAGNQSPKKSRKVKLSPRPVAVAKRLGVPLEEYAKQFVALNN
jgi:Pyruvate/2-oxoacid:ferredoxin oxidoreductase gamma subunit